MTVAIVPIFFAEAAAFIGRHHRHNKPPVGGIFWMGAADDAGKLVGVAVVGRPIARFMQDGRTVEVLRNCVLDDAPLGTPSALYGACWRAAKALGWQRLITTTLQSESGASLRGAGWRVLAERKPANPEAWLNRPGRAFQPVVGQAKLVWEAA